METMMERNQEHLDSTTLFTQNPSQNVEFTDNGEQGADEVPSERTDEVTSEHLQMTTDPAGATMEQGRAVRFMNMDREKEALARLMWLLIDAGTSSLKATFDSIHPPVNLRDHLSQPHIRSVLIRLHQQAILTDKQWKLLYPAKKKHVSSQKYDSRTLVILLQTICHLCPPYPNGWSTQPLSTDNSISADIVRLQLLHQQLADLVGLTMDEYAHYWKHAREVLLRLGGPPVRVKLHRIEHELIPPENQNHYIQIFREHWGSSNNKLDKLRNSVRKKENKPKRTPRSKKDDQEGLPPEDRAVLMKTYKMFVDNILADDILDRLVQNQVIKFGDRQDILGLSKNSERMQLLLDKILNTKLSYGFKALCDAVKFKYPKVYETAMQIRKETYKQGITDTIDVVSVCQEALSSCYKIQFSRCQPFPWNESVHVNIRDLYAPLDILDSEGKKLHMSEILPPQATNGRGPRIMLEGATGSGKSTLCGMLAYMWATQRSYFKNKYTFLLYIDAQLLEGNLTESVYKQLLPDNFKIGADEFWSMLEANAREVIVLLDGYDGGTDMADVHQILSGTRLRHGTVMVAVNPEMLPNNSFVPDLKYYNMGLNHHHIQRCLKTCMNLTRLDPEENQMIFDLVADDTWDLQPYVAQPYICLLLFAVYHILPQTEFKEIKTLSSLLETYSIAMATQFCRRQNLDVMGFEFPDEIVRTMAQLEKFAFSSILDQKRVFSEEEIIKETQNAIVFKMGAFSRFSAGSNYKFTCGLQQDFLAAKHMAEMVMEEMNKKLQEHRILKHPKFTQMVSLLCGLYSKDFDTPILRTLFTELAIKNARQTRGVVFQEPSSSESDVKPQPASGQVLDFSQSLQSMAECKGREDVYEGVEQSIPSRLVLKRDGLVPVKVLESLSLLMASEGSRISELEIHLLPPYAHQQKLYQDLAIAAGKSKQLSTLKIVWSSLDVMSKFLCTVLADSESLQQVSLDDACKKPIKQVSAATWATLQEACQSLKAKTFSFLNCKLAALVYHVIHHLPDTVRELDFTGCAMNMVCACELSAKLEHAEMLQRLDLSFTKLDSTEFVAVLQGLKLCDTIKHLKLCGSKLDRPGVMALAECLRLTKGLECLDLSECELSTDMCKKLANAIGQNRSLNKLILKNTKVTIEGRMMISHTKIDQVQVVGLDDFTYALYGY